MNAKELILKKINADTNWVDIYTSGVILGEDINAIGSFMTSSITNDLVSKYNTSAFDTEYIGTKIDFIKKAISEETDSNKKEAYNELLRRVYIAEELRIMGKILKINQGMPTNLSDLQQYISSIEQYIESRINHVNLENYQNAISQFNELKKRLGLSEELMGDDLNISEVANALKQIKKAKEQMTSNWIYFDFVKFVQDPEYAKQMDNVYESVKITFNILNTLRQSPHFNEMFKVLGLNSTILTSLSKRNLIERSVWNTAAHKSSKGKAVIQTKLNSTERIILKNLIDDTLADTWIKSNISNLDGSPVRIIWTVNDKPNVITFDGGFDYKLFIKYIETELIPRLRNNLLIVNGQTIETANNAFIKHLTFGKDRDGNTIFRLPYNMTQIDKNPGIQAEYEKILNAFGQLRGIILDNGLSVVDMFYLYNLIVHKDKFSRSALTRLFEDLIASDGGEQLLVFKFNEWLETVNEEEIINKVLGNWVAIHSNNDSNRKVILERVNEEFVKLQNSSKMIDINTISPKTESFGVVFPKQGKTSQALKSEYQQWQIDNPTGIVAYRVKFPYNTVEEVQLGHIGNPFSENARGANTVQQFYDWLVTGNNFGNEKATDEYRRAIISKLLSTPANSPILYYTELNRPSHATVLGYLIANKQLLSNQSSPSPVQFDDPIDISEESVAEEPVTIGFDNTDKRVDNESDETSDTFHINQEYITEREQILANASRNSEGKLLAPNGKVSKLSEEQWVTVRTKSFKEWFGDWTKITQNKDGSWNIPDNVSKVIDHETGEPLVVYHGSETVFDKFDIRFFGKTDAGDLGRGHYFAYEEEVALGYGPNIYEVFLNIQNPFIHTGIKTADVVKNFNREYNPTNREKLLQQIKTAKLNIEEHTRRFKESDEKIFKEINDKKIKYYTALLSGLQSDLENTSEEILDSRIVDTLDQYDGVMESNPHYQLVVRRDDQIKSATGNVGTFSNTVNTIYDSDPTPVYQTTPSKQSKLIEVVRQAREKGIKGLHAVSQSDLINEDIYIRSAFGFVRNGEVYINVDRAGDDTVIHEFGHLYLADAKNNNRLAYYALLEKVKDTALWKEMRKWAAYANKIGSDFDEEILATMIGDYYKAEFENYEYESLVKEALELVDPAFIELLNSEILPDLGDTFITNYYFQQKVSTWKSKLVSDNILKENCL